MKVLHGLLARAFSGWFSCAAQHARLRTLANTCTGRMRHLQQHAAFAGWRCWAQHRAKHRLLIALIVHQGTPRTSFSVS